MLLEYFAGTSFVHRLDVRAKLVAFTVVIVCTFLLRSPVANGALAVGSFLLLLAIGVPLRAIGTMLLPLLPIVACIVVFAALGGQGGGDPTVITHLWFNGGLPLTVGGLLHGSALGLRIITMVLLTSVLVLSTPIEEFVALMRAMRLPFPVVFIVMTALRFVPTLQHRSEQILDAQRARGAKIDGGGIVGRIRAYTTIMVPLFATGIRMSEDLAAAMLSRGYGISKQPTQLLVLRMTWRDPVVITGSAVVLGAAIWLRTMGW